MLKIVLLFSLLCATAAAQPLVVGIRSPLQPVSIGGKAVLAYELDLANQTPEPLSLSRLEVTDERGATLLFYDQNELARNAIQVAPAARGKLTSLKAGSRAVVFCWIENAPATLARIRNRVSYSAASQPTEVEAEVARPTGLTLAPPVEAGDWWIANGPSNTSEHRRAQIRRDGDAGAPFGQRYAIDFVRICDGRAYLNKGKSNSDYCSYGTKVLAVADAQVLISKDGIPDNTPGSVAVKLSKDTLLGNYVVLQLGSGRVAVYAHLKPESLLVKPGDTVRRGQEIARLGNTGNSDAPHLHFHVSQEGAAEDIALVQTSPVPYVFDALEEVGSYSGKGLTSAPAKPRTADLPAEGAVIRFR